MSVRCSQCKLLKDESSFYKNSRKANGLESSCKECVSKKKKQKYEDKKKKAKRRRSGKRKTLAINDCTISEKLITKPATEMDTIIQEITKELLWQMRKEVY